MEENDNPYAPPKSDPDERTEKQPLPWSFFIAPLIFALLETLMILNFATSILALGQVEIIGAATVIICVHGFGTVLLFMRKAFGLFVHMLVLSFLGLYLSNGATSGYEAEMAISVFMAFGHGIVCIFCLYFCHEEREKRKKPNVSSSEEEL